MKIIARKPRSSDAEYAVIDRGEDHRMPFVSATINPQSVANGEWFWGYYFATRDEAMEHFNSRKGV